MRRRMKELEARIKALEARLDPLEGNLPKVREHRDILIGAVGHLARAAAPLAPPKKDAPTLVRKMITEWSRKEPIRDEWQLGDKNTIALNETEIESLQTDIETNILLRTFGVHKQLTKLEGENKVTDVIENVNKKITA